MKVIILAAGKGSRLGDPFLPKPLTRLANGQSILEHQLHSISDCLSLDQVILVVGYCKEMIMDQFPNLLFAYNASYAQENTSQSLLKALNKVDEDVLWMNGDVVFHPSVLPKILAVDRTCMLVNEGPVGEEEVKYCLDSQGKIVEISKEVVHAKGEALGVNLFKAKDAAVLRKALTQCQPQDYFEKGIEIAIKQGMSVWSCPINASYCTEIDFPEDLEKANLLIKTWTTPYRDNYKLE